MSPRFVRSALASAAVRPFCSGKWISRKLAALGVTFNPSFALKYRGEKFRPQLNFAYSKIISPAVISREEDGVISVGPEILYAIRPNMLIGGAYSYSTPLTKDVDVNSHTVTLEFRWIF